MSFMNLIGMIMQGRQQERQDEMMRPYREAQIRQMQLANDANALQVSQDQALRDALANAQPVTTASIMPRLEQSQVQPQPSFANLIGYTGKYNNAPGFTMPQQQASPVVQAYKENRMQIDTTQPNRAQIAANTLLGQGRFAEAKSVIDLDDHLAQQSAKAQISGGDMAGFYANKAKLDIYKDVLGTISPLVKTQSGRQIAGPLLEQYKKTFPGMMDNISIDSFGMQGDQPYYDLKDERGNVVARYIRNPESGNLEYHPPSALEGMDKRFEQQMRIAEFNQNRQDARQSRQLAAVLSRQQNNGTTGGKAPSGYRWTADGNLEPIPGGPGANKNTKQIPAGQLEGLADQRKMLDNLQGAQGLIGKVTTGPVSGRWQKGEAIFGKAPKPFVELRQKIATVNNIMLKLRSGAAVTEQEYARFMEEMPTVNDAGVTFQIKLDNATAYARSLFEEKIANYEEGGYRVPGRLKWGNPQGNPQPQRTAPRQQAPAPKGKPAGKPRNANEFLSSIGG